MQLPILPSLFISVMTCFQFWFSLSARIWTSAVAHPWIIKTPLSLPLKQTHLLVTESLLDLLALELFLAVEVFRGTYASPLLCLARDEAVLRSHTGFVGEVPRRESFQLLFPWYGSRSFGLYFIPLLFESCLCRLPVLESCLCKLPVLESCL